MIDQFRPAHPTPALEAPFRDTAPALWAAGYPAFPGGTFNEGKEPAKFMRGHQRFGKATEQTTDDGKVLEIWPFPSETEQADWLKNGGFGNCHIVMGRQAGQTEDGRPLYLVAIDVDTNDRAYLAQFVECFPELTNALVKTAAYEGAPAGRGLTIICRSPLFTKKTSFRLSKLPTEWSFNHKKRCNVEKDPGVDFLTNGSYTVAGGSFHPDTRQGYVWTHGVEWVGEVGGSIESVVRVEDLPVFDQEHWSRLVKLSEGYHKVGWPSDPLKNDTQDRAPRENGPVAPEIDRGTFSGQLSSAAQRYLKFLRERCSEAQHEKDRQSKYHHSPRRDKIYSYAIHMWRMEMSGDMPPGSTWHELQATWAYQSYAAEFDEQRADSHIRAGIRTAEQQGPASVKYVLKEIQINWIDLDDFQGEDHDAIDWEGYGGGKPDLKLVGGTQIDLEEAIADAGGRPYEGQGQGQGQDQGAASTTPLADALDMPTDVVVDAGASASASASVSVSASAPPPAAEQRMEVDAREVEDLGDGYVDINEKVEEEGFVPQKVNRSIEAVPREICESAPGWVGTVYHEIMRLAPTTPPTIALQTALACASHLTARRYYGWTDGRHLACRLFVVALGGTNAGKEFCHQFPRELWARLEALADPRSLIADHGTPANKFRFHNKNNQTWDQEGAVYAALRPEKAPYTSSTPWDGQQPEDSGEGEDSGEEEDTGPAMSVFRLLGRFAEGLTGPAALLKAFRTKSPALFLSPDEFGKEWARWNRSSSAENATIQLMKQLYSDRRRGVGGNDYADSANRQPHLDAPILMPALTLFGLGTPDDFYEEITKRMAFDGALNRLLIAREDGEARTKEDRRARLRGGRGQKRDSEISQDLIQGAADIALFGLHNQTVTVGGDKRIYTSGADKLVNPWADIDPNKDMIFIDFDESSQEELDAMLDTLIEFTETYEQLKQIRDGATGEEKFVSQTASRITENAYRVVHILAACDRDGMDQYGVPLIKRHHVEWTCKYMEIVANNLIGLVEKQEGSEIEQLLKEADDALMERYFDQLSNPNFNLLQGASKGNKEVMAAIKHEAQEEGWVPMRFITQHGETRDLPGGTVITTLMGGPIRNKKALKNRLLKIKLRDKDWEKREVDYSINGKEQNMVLVRPAQE